MRGKISVGVAVVLLGLMSSPRQGVCQRPQAGMAGLSQAQVTALEKMKFPVRMSVIYKRFGRGQYKTHAAVLYPSVVGDLSLTYKNGWFTGLLRLNGVTCYYETGKPCKRS